MCDVVGVAVADCGDELLQHRQQHTSARLTGCECLATSPADEHSTANELSAVVWCFCVEGAGGQRRCTIRVAAEASVHACLEL